MSTVHAGSIIEKVVRRKNVSISSLSRKLNVNRRTLYNWFNQETLPSKLIGKIGHNLGHDFSLEFSSALSGPDLKIIEDVTMSMQRSENENAETYQYWMCKYIELLEKYNALLVKNN
ncbi:helix-turn-helix domain-containing protein [Daejeonella oryzae]|uniref:helix-turn-helix domain-containing protein n=1 Tax=Daejeonella oryzae TaxID=1122943 RepID=UPI0004265228|nr:helix-turn-helix domain-containing protein [Daejeonella oryzae]